MLDMNTSSTTCQLTNAVDYQGAAPTTITDVWNFNTIACDTIFYGSSSVEIASSSLPSVSGGFTYGEQIQTTFLFIIMVLLVYRTLRDWVRGVKIQK